jgi:cytochrome P450 PksS
MVTLWGQGHGENPFPIYDRLRSQAAASKVRMAGAVRMTADGEVWVITRYEEAVQVLKDPRLTVDRRNVGYKTPTLQRWVMGAMGMDGGGMVGVDGAEHSRLRGLVAKAFTPRAIESLQTWIAEMTEDLLDKAAAKSAREGQVDLIAELALPLPLNVISEMVGVPEAERWEFAKLVNLMFNFAAERPNLVAMATAGFRLRRYFSRLITLKRRQPDDRLLCELMKVEEAGDKLSENELAGTILLLLFAGHETTVNLIGNGVLALLDRPDQIKLLHERPDLAASTVEELLRFAPPVEYGVVRYATEDLMLADTIIPKGDGVIALLSAAGRDERAFDHPNTLDITREKNRQITFGMGHHICLGAPLARMEGVIAFRALARRLPTMELAVPRDRLEWWHAGGLRGLKTLPVRFA